uniref:TMSB4Y n=1 Tax=Gorilla gorilla TaxID=9593 RepID=W8BYT9_9PRIM
MSDKPCMAEIEKFDKPKLISNRRSKQVNLKQACATNIYCTFYKHCFLILLLLLV